MQHRVVDELLAAEKLQDRQIRTVRSRESDTASDQELNPTQRIIEKAEQFVASHPAICLGSAAAAGMALGWWIKRQ